ncbi:hypothetical protein REPUB_Repub10bG0045200 [Reevesia pubescens]
MKKYLEKGGDAIEDDNKNFATILCMPSKFFESFIMQGLHVDLIERGRLLCSMKVPPCLLVDRVSNFLHDGATASLVDLVGLAVICTYGVTSTRVSMEINVHLNLILLRKLRMILLMKKVTN